MTEYFDNIRHILESEHAGPLIITDPIGYENSNEELTRTFDNVGMIANFSMDLKFIDDGADYLRNIIENFGVNEVVTIRREEKDSFDVWQEVYTSTFDLSTFSEETGQISVKINSGGLNAIIKSRESEKIEIERLTSIDGDVLPELETREIQIVGREMFLKTQFDVTDNDNNAYMYNSTNGNTRGKTVTVPLNAFSKSHDDAHSPNPNTNFDDNSHDRSANGITGIMFFANSDVARRLNLKLDLSFRPMVMQDNDTNWIKFWLRFAIYKNGTQYNYSSAVNVWYTESIWEYHNQLMHFDMPEFYLDIEAGDSISLQFCQLMDGENGHRAVLEINCVDIDATLTIEEDSLFESTSTKTILLHELGERLSSIITGEQNRFKSSVFGRTDLGYSENGKWGYVGAYSGHWLRGFDLSDYNLDPEKDRYKKFTTSFKDFKETVKTMFNIHIGYQKIGYEEKVIAEDFSYFFNPNIVLTLPNPLTNVKRYIAEDLLFSGIRLGYEKGAEVESVMGLDEPNGQSNWITNLTRITNNYELLAKYITSVYNEEKQRRYQKSSYPTTDTDLDKDIFLKDLKLIGSDLIERIWSDDYISPPTGVFSPDTVKNLRFSPAQLLRRHSNVLATPFKNYQDKVLAFGSSTGNSSMINYTSEGEIRENGNLLNSDLGNRIFEQFYIEGDHLVDYEIMNLLKSNSLIEGVEIPNFYCKIAFRLEGDEDTLRYGYLMSLKPGEEGKWKFIEASNVTIEV